jgi:uncharacterized protein YbjT (DUF2867 family)
MIILSFGATGLAGSGVLRACLAAPDVGEVRAVVRRSTGLAHPKLRETLHTNYLDYSAIADTFAGVDACFFCLGVSVQQAPVEADYRRIHLEFPMAAGRVLRERSPAAQFHYLSGGRAGIDSRWMWARVKGEAERELMREFGATCWRPAMIGGAPGANTALWLKMLRPILTPIFSPFRGLYIESDDIGRAMLEATRRNIGPRILENDAMRELAG